MFLALTFYIVVRYVFAGANYRQEKVLLGLDLMVLLGLFFQSRKSLGSAYGWFSQILGVEPPGLSMLTTTLLDGAVGQSYKQALMAGEKSCAIETSIVHGKP
jgi:hypothetical protein